MPTSSQRRPWSTQYKDDFNARTAGMRRKSIAKPKVCMFRPRVPQATPIVTSYNGPPIYGGKHYGLEDPYCPSDEEEDPMPINPNVVGVDMPHVVTDPTADVYVGADPEVEPAIPEPTDISREPHWLSWPEPKTKKRPHTSLGFHRDTNVHETSGTGYDQLSVKGAPLTYEPGLNGWTNAKENDRKTVNNMYQLQRSQSFYEPARKPMTSISVNDPPARDTYSLYGNGGPGNSVDPTGVYRQSFFPYHKPGGHGAREEQIMRMLANRMDGKSPGAYGYNYSFNKYPLHMRGKRFPVVSEDYVHDQSMFMTTTPRCVGHFIIHPDWVSEKSALRRSNTMVMPPKKTSGLRY